VARYLLVLRCVDATDRRSDDWVRSRMSDRWEQVSRYMRSIELGCVWQVTKQFEPRWKTSMREKEE
jgi:hypothetical protein